LARRATLDRAAPDSLLSDTALLSRAWLEAQHGHNQTVKADGAWWMTPGENAGENGSGL